MIILEGDKKDEDQRITGKGIKLSRIFLTKCLCCFRLQVLHISITDLLMLVLKARLPRNWSAWLSNLPMQGQ